jgi:hypothetical protein
MLRSVVGILVMLFPLSEVALGLSRHDYAAYCARTKRLVAGIL